MMKALLPTTLLFGLAAILCPAAEEGDVVHTFFDAVGTSSTRATDGGTTSLE